jgi:hypothetical protein
MPNIDIDFTYTIGKYSNTDHITGFIYSEDIFSKDKNCIFLRNRKIYVATEEFCTFLLLKGIVYKSRNPGYGIDYHIYQGKDDEFLSEIKIL